jgi:hypothetical protein
VFCFDYKCDHCGFRATAVRGAIGYYRFDDGQELHALAEPAWCYVCADITSVESLKPTKAIIEEIDRLNRRAFNDWDVECAEQLRESIDDVAGKRIERLQDYKKRFESRTIPNRCIECGFSDFRELASFSTSGDIPESLLHFKCGGTLRQVDASHAIPATYFVLDADGNRLCAGRPT